jgi:hypothetical protein
MRLALPSCPYHTEKGRGNRHRYLCAEALIDCDSDSMTSRFPPSSDRRVGFLGAAASGGDRTSGLGQA